MDFIAGTSRYILVLSGIGLVLKFPRIYVRNTLLSFRNVVQFFGWWRAFRDIFENNGLTHPHLLKGLYDNWREAWRWWELRHDFIQPTYFSLFGLVNVQRYGRPLELDGPGFLTELARLTNSLAWKDMHHFGNPGNFTWRDDHLVMLDYGGTKSLGLIVTFGDRIALFFDPTRVGRWREDASTKTNVSPATAEGSFKEPA